MYCGTDDCCTVSVFSTIDLLQRLLKESILAPLWAALSQSHRSVGWTDHFLEWADKAAGGNRTCGAASWEEVWWSSTDCHLKTDSSLSSTSTLIRTPGCQQG